MSALVSLAAVLILMLIAWLGTGGAGLTYVFGVLIPYLALAVFLAGFVRRVLKWASAPVPFNITTTCGQQKSLPWIENSPIECPHTKLGVVARMALEVLCFRSLFRNTQTDLVGEKGLKVVYRDSLWLWAGAIAFHYAFLVILLRHLGLFTDPQPYLIGVVEKLDGFFQVGSPTIYITTFVLLGAVLFLLGRRLALPQVRYISLLQDYFPLLLILGIACTGAMMRYLDFRVDITAVKNLATNLAALNLPEARIAADGIGAIFYVHLFLVCALACYFPYSKLMHMGGVFLSPTRNLIAASRMVRHVNPWNPKVKLHTYEEYEDEFRDKMVKAGIPVDKQPPPKEEAE